MAAERPITKLSARVRGVELSYDREGDGPLVIFCHGLMNDRRSMEDSGVFDWSPIVDSGHTLIRVDLRGHGASTGDTEPAHYTWSSLGADLLDLLEQLSPDQPVAAIGCSMGTASLLHAAVAAPHRFSRLVLTAPPTAWETRRVQAEGYLRLADVAERGGRAAMEELVAAQPVTGVLAESTAPFQVCVSDALLASVLRGAAATDLPEPETLRHLRLPTLILSWAGDPSHPVTTGEHVHELLGRSRFAVAESLAEVQHWGVDAADFLRA